jgi:hypothetical protein
MAFVNLFSFLPLCLFAQHCQFGNIIGAHLHSSIVINNFPITPDVPKDSVSFSLTKNEEKDCNRPYLEATTGNITCKQDKVMLTSFTSAIDASVWWITPNNNTLQGANIETCEIGLHKVFVKDNNTGCVASKSVMVTDGRMYPKVTTIGGLIDCNRPETTLHTAASTKNLLFHWTGPNNFSETFASPTVDAPGRYILTCIEPNSGCKSVDSAFVTMDKTNPTVKCSMVTDVNNTKNNIWVSAIGSSLGSNFQYRWWSFNGYSVEPYDSTFAQTTEADIYTLSVFNTKNGCSASANIWVGTDDSGLKSKSSSEHILELHKFNFWVEEPWRWRKIKDSIVVSKKYSSDECRSSEEHCTLLSQFNR